MKYSTGEQVAAMWKGVLGLVVDPKSDGNIHDAKIETTNPSGYEWNAMTDSYEPGMPLGIGATESEAVADLKAQLAEAEETK